MQPDPLANLLTEPRAISPILWLMECCLPADSHQTTWQEFQTVSICRSPDILSFQIKTHTHVSVTCLNWTVGLEFRRKAGSYWNGWKNKEGYSASEKWEIWQLTIQEEYWSWLTSVSLFSAGPAPDHKPMRQAMLLSTGSAPGQASISWRVYLMMLVCHQLSCLNSGPCQWMLLHHKQIKFVLNY